MMLSKISASKKCLCMRIGCPENHVHNEREIASGWVATKRQCDACRDWHEIEGAVVFCLGCVNVDLDGNPLKTP